MPDSGASTTRPWPPDASPAPPLLELRGVDVRHGSLLALSDVSFALDEGGLAVVLGANGAGKSTLLDAIMGLLPAQPARGTISFAGTRIDGMATERIVRAGVSYVPEGRRLFGELTVQENLAVGAYVQRDPRATRRSLERVYQQFPLLAERRGQAADTLSGGEQQMLAIGRALMSGPRLLLLDEPSLGLAPVLVHRLLDIVMEIRGEGVTVLLVEQNARLALSAADIGVVLDAGVLVATGRASELIDNSEVASLYMGSLMSPPPSNPSNGLR